MNKKENFASGLYPAGRTSRLVDRLLASDPGLKRLRNACRVMLVVSFAAALASPIALFAGVVVAPLIGGVVSLLSAMAVWDETLGGRKVTTLLLFLPASLSVAVGGLLSAVVWPQWLALAVIVFFAFYLRRFGARYVAVGMMAAILFIVASLVSSFIGFGVGDLPWIFVAIAGGVASAYVVRFYMLPDNPSNALDRGISAFDIQLGLTLEAITETLSDRRNDDERRKRLRRESDRLHERVFAVEGELLSGETDVSRERSDGLRLYLFDAEMSANALAEIVWRDVNSDPAFPEDVRRPLLRALGELYLTLRQGLAAEQTLESLEELERARVEAATATPENWSFQARRTQAAIRQLAQGASEEQEEGPAAVADEDGGEEDAAEADREPRRGGIAGKLRPTTVQGIQATVAVSAALAAGQVFSPSRPYWVVIIALVVFIGSGTMSDTLTKGFQRSVGTLGGAVAGLLLVGLVAGNMYVEIALIAVCAFLAFYAFSLSQTLMMFWITVMLAAVFDIGGMLGNGLLTLRVFDTLLGSAIGLAVSALVLPTKPSDEFRDTVTDFLDSLEGYVGDRVRWLSGGEPKRHPVERAREVQRKLDAVVQNATVARRQALVFGRSRTDFDHWMTGLLALSYYARHLSGPVGRRERPPEGSRQSKLLREIGGRMTSNIGSLREAVSSGKEPEVREIESLMEELEEFVGGAELDERRPAGETSVQAAPLNALHYLRRINRTLDELSSAPAIGNRKRSGS